MTDLVYNYPKTSCYCENCENKKFTEQPGNPTNMSVRGCNFSKSYDCYPVRVFREQNEPIDKKGLKLLNPEIVSIEKLDKTFHRINSKTCPASACSGITYSNSDARLCNAAAGTRLQLNTPPMNSAVKLNDLYNDKTLDSYGQGYRSYADVNAGQILYYIDKSIEDVEFKPVFSKPGKVVASMYKDPMGAMKPNYDRIHENYCHVLQDPCNVTGDVCLSFLRDTQDHRADLISRQMRQHNEQRYEPRWANQ